MKHVYALFCLLFFFGKSKIREKVFDQIKLHDLKKETDLDIFLDRCFNRQLEETVDYRRGVTRIFDIIFGVLVTHSNLDTFTVKI